MIIMIKTNDGYSLVSNLKFTVSYFYMFNGNLEMFLGKLCDKLVRSSE